VKIELDFGHCGRWRRMRVATLLKDLRYSGGTPTCGSPISDDCDLRCRFPQKTSFLEQTMVGVGSEVERLVSSPSTTAGLGTMVSWTLD
jgi:hypothetical protein